jgi:hypothetical protein
MVVELLLSVVHQHMAHMVHRRSRESVSRGSFHLHDRPGLQPACAVLVDPKWAVGLDHILVKIGNTLHNNPYAEQTYRKGAYQDKLCVLDSNTAAGAQCRVTATGEMLIVPYEFLHPTPPEAPNQGVVIISPPERGRRTMTQHGDRMTGMWEVQSAPGRPYGPGQLCRQV